MCVCETRLPTSIYTQDFKEGMKWYFTQLPNSYCYIRSTKENYWQEQCRIFWRNLKTLMLLRQNYNTNEFFLLLLLSIASFFLKFAQERFLKSKVVFIHCIYIEMCYFYIVSFFAFAIYIWQFFILLKVREHCMVCVCVCVCVFLPSGQVKTRIERTWG